MVRANIAGYGRSDNSRSLSSKITELAFIASTISDLDTFIGNLRPGVEAVILGGSTSALAQMEQTLRSRENIKVIHVVAHGSAGSVQFSSGALTGDTLDHYTTELSRIGEALGTGGNLLLWSCNTASGEVGKTFVDALARITHVNVAGATGRVGSAAFGGEWIIEATKFFSHLSRQLA
jgi:hypothetical protein